MGSGRDLKSKAPKSVKQKQTAVETRACETMLFEGGVRSESWEPERPIGDGDVKGRPLTGTNFLAATINLALLQKENLEIVT